MTDLRLVTGDLDSEIADKIQQARNLWADIGAKMLLFETERTDTDRFNLARLLEASATGLATTYDELALLVEKREEGSA